MGDSVLPPVDTTEESQAIEHPSSSSEETEKSTEKEFVRLEEMERKPLIPDNPDEVMFYLRDAIVYDIRTVVRKYYPFAISAKEIDCELVVDCLDGRPYKDMFEDIFAWEDKAIVIIHVEKHRMEVGLSYKVVNMRSVWATIIKNCKYINEVRFYFDGMPIYGIDTFPTDKNGAFVGEDIALPELSPEEMAALRASVEYTSPYVREWSQQLWRSFTGLVLDEPLVRDLEYYLATLFNTANEPSVDFEDIFSPEAHKFASNAAIARTPSCYVGAYKTDYPEIFAPQLEPIIDAGMPQKIVEHVNQTGKLLFGEQYEFRPNDCKGGAWSFDRYTGTFMPVVWDYFVDYIPVILEYSEFEDRYELVLVIIEHAYAGDSEDGETYECSLDGSVIDEAEIAKRCHSSSSKRRVVIRKGANGEFYMWSHTFLGSK